MTHTFDGFMHADGWHGPKALWLFNQLMSCSLLHTVSAFCRLLKRATRQLWFCSDRMLTSDNGMGMDEQAAEQGRSSGGSDAPQGLQWGTGPGPAPVSPTKKKSLSGAKAAKEAQVGIAAGFSWGTCNSDLVEQPKAECCSGSVMQCCQSDCLSYLMHAL